jgi:hypothetical protein
MDADEREIVHFLKTRGGEYVGAVEIARRAGSKKKFYEDSDWAKPVLMRMVDHGLLQNDSHGRYRIKPRSRKDKNKRYVAPDIEKILQESGVEVEDTHDEVADATNGEP